MEQKRQIPEWIADVQHCHLDLYDLAALVLIYHRYSRKEEENILKQIIIDEAQDFGVMIYYVLHTVLSARIYHNGGCFTKYSLRTGMYWKELRKYVFSDPNDCFHMLRKSYRNTIEISHYASHILDQATFETYPIDPIVRHTGEPVHFYQCQEENEMVKTALKILMDEKNKGYDTMAVICRDEEETQHVRELLSEKMTLFLKEYNTQDISDSEIAVMNRGRRSFSKGNPNFAHIFNKRIGI